MLRIKIYAFLSIICFISCLQYSLAQHVTVEAREGEQLMYPWAGGLNSCQFGEIDLNGNGIYDLFVFDRQGNRILCFLNEGIPGEINYTYAPEYALKFPKLQDWAILADYDGDGKADIFTYSPGWAGIQVYRNVSEGELAFERVVFPYLTSFQGGGHVNILATNADYPAIVDLDGDGDLDILSFWALGTYIQQHTNRSIETYGHADSLDFEQTSFCWGRIAENEENNLIYLDSCLFNSPRGEQNRAFRHRGATMRVMDLNNNGLPDLILGDVDYPGLTQLINGGTAEEAFIISQDTAFPSYDVPVRLFSMPATALVDVNNNGLKDLIVSPFDPSPIVSENKNSVWLYLNEGTPEQPLFRLHTKSFLQDQMIDLGSGAYPLLHDVNQDGLPDLVVGNYGYYRFSWYEFGMLKSRYVAQVAYYENTGDPGQPSFQLMDNDVAGLSSLGLRGFVPAMADLSGNGLPDLLVGSETGKLIYIEQTSAANWMIRDQEYGGINVGSYSAPQLFDIDGDGVVDLVIGSRTGKIAFYKGFENIGVISFIYVTDELGGVNVTDFDISYDGYSTPCFFYSADEELYLAVGSEQGKIFLFDQISENLAGGMFRESDQLGALLDTNIMAFDLGMRTAAYLTDLYGNGTLSMIAGNYGGGLQLFNAMAEVSPGLSLAKKEIGFELYPNPAGEHARLVLAEIATTKTMVRLFNLKGQVIKQYFIDINNSSADLNMSGLPQGVYLVEVMNAQARASTKLIKF